MQFINDNDESKVTTPDLEVAEKSLAPAKDGSETAEMKVCFKNLQAFSACFDAFAHGGNDVGWVCHFNTKVQTYFHGSCITPCKWLCNTAQSNYFLVTRLGPC